MVKSLLFGLYLLGSVVALAYATDYHTARSEGRRAYDVNALVREISENIKESKKLKEWSSLEHLQLDKGSGDIVFSPSERLLQNSSRCLEDILYILWNIKSQWALQMFDSYGKPESGILEGNYLWVGDYDECVAVRSSNSNSSVGNFGGKYCSLSWSLSLGNTSLPFSFNTGICIPDSCSEEDLMEDAHQLLSVAGIQPVLHGSKLGVSSNTLSCRPTEKHLNVAAKLVIAVLSLLFMLVVVGSFITAARYIQKIVQDARNPGMNAYIAQDRLMVGDITPKSQGKLESDTAALLENEDNKGALQKLETVLSCFCVFKNGAKLLNTEASEGELLAVHGIRFLSMSWVILGHSYIFGYRQIKNMVQLFSLVDNFPFQAILQAFSSVDSFFVLSGFLLCYLYMREAAKNKGNMSWPYFYIHRYVRLTPMYMLLLAFYATVFCYLGEGPFWLMGDYDPACAKVWWRNLLYINNFDIYEGQCFGHTWYLANDMQFFIISPIFLISLWRWPKAGYVVLAAFLLATAISSFVITYHFDLVAGLISFIHNGKGMDISKALVKFTEYFDKIYIKPYTRIGPYLIGILAGYFVFKRKASNAPKHSLLFLCVGWAVASAVTLTCVYGLYHKNPSLTANSFYNAFSRTAYAMGLSWVIYVCLIGQGGVVNSILSFKLFIPLSRLTYAAYLIHPMIITGYYYNLRTTIQFAHPTMVAYFLAFMVVTYCLALPVALILESPIVCLEKLVRKSFMKSQKPEAVN